MTSETCERPGILPSKMLRSAVQGDIIISDYRVPEENYQPASLDLRLGETAHMLQCSFLPHPGTVRERLPSLSMGEIDLRDGAILDRNRVYLIPLLESLELPPGLKAKANPKSSTGRLDIFTRVITERSERFDDIPEGYKGPLYLELFSRSFTIRVRTRLCLNQIRVYRGNPTLDQDELERAYSEAPIVLPNQSELTAFPDRSASLGLSIDLTGAPGQVGYRARKNSKLLDLSLLGNYQPEDFWEPVSASRDGTLILDCIISYGDPCASGRSRIFSVRQDGVRIATGEIQHSENSWREAQTRGRNNQPVPDHVRSAVVQAAELYIAAHQSALGQNNPHWAWLVPHTPRGGAAAT